MVSGNVSFFKNFILLTSIPFNQGPRNLVTSVESFVMRPVAPQEVKVSREENLQKLVSKTEVASKKKEEIMKAQLEERIKWVKEMVVVYQFHS